MGKTHLSAGGPRQVGGHNLFQNLQVGPVFALTTSWWTQLLQDLRTTLSTSFVWLYCINVSQSYMLNVTPHVSFLRSTRKQMIWEKVVTMKVW